MRQPRVHPSALQRGKTGLGTWCWLIYFAVYNASLCRLPSPHMLFIPLLSTSKRYGIKVNIAQPTHVAVGVKKV